VRVVADSHAIVWYVQGSKRLSERAGEVLAEAEAERSLVVSVATLIDLWYVSQTTQSVTAEQLAALRERLASSEAVCPGAGDCRHRGRHDQYPESQRPRPLGPADHGDRDRPSGPPGDQGHRYPGFGIGGDHLVNGATWPPRR
jgi:hypothetical protein